MMPSDVKVATLAMDAAAERDPSDDSAQGRGSQRLLAVVSAQCGQAAPSGLFAAKALASLPDMVIMPAAAILGSSGPGLT